MYAALFFKLKKAREKPQQQKVVFRLLVLTAFDSTLPEIY